MTSVVTLWWHVFGSEIPDLSIDADGNAAPGWAQVVMGESTMTPVDAQTKQVTSLGHPLTYLGSFDHDPTDDERDGLTPPEYREEQP